MSVTAAILGASAILLDSGLAHARGGAPNLMDSPGYQRRLQESRQQLQAQPAPAQPVVHHKKRHKRQH
ncbi:hypothetical protein AFIC_002080 [[Pseudomonas] carboxydohydrogena]|uniref:Uncharacterized protein n=1 Tax=Afipia carboxydohydrogena TaxID=290 RepID=A0ABY8BMC1_AFICR|nr:hypothetical protein [[Pseudomonas] carboxydohydrogena]WEF50536.1 hypothetical protein AFIC_002080 [[Pseudomonas] carboxydohydrogena]